MVRQFIRLIRPYTVGKLTMPLFYLKPFDFHPEEREDKRLTLLFLRLPIEVEDDATSTLIGLVIGLLMIAFVVAFVVVPLIMVLNNAAP
jgi:hypothetical protein